MRVANVDTQWRLIARVISGWHAFVLGAYRRHDGGCWHIVILPFPLWSWTIVSMACVPMKFLQRHTQALAARDATRLSSASQLDLNLAHVTPQLKPQPGPRPPSGSEVEGGT